MIWNGKGALFVQAWKDKQLVDMISTLHNTTLVNAGRKDKKTNVEIRKPYCIVQYNKFTKRVDMADQYLSYYSIEGKTVKC